MKESIRLRSGRAIGRQHPCFIVAEVGNNHQGSLDMALEMIREAARCGADAIKFQKRDSESLLTTEGRNAPYNGKNSFGRTYGEHRDALELDIEEMARAKALAEELGLVFFASTWDAVSLRQMEELDVELLKISSADLVSLPLLRQAGAMGTPIILSTGMSDYPEIDMAVGLLRRYHDNLVILHCNSSYPCPEEQIALPVIEQLRERYGLPVGYSGHEQGLGPSVAAAALGACVVERHFTLDRSLPGTDHKVSLDPQGLAQLVTMVREVEKAFRARDKQVFPSEVSSAKKLRKSIVFARDLPAGHVLTKADITIKCPGTGLSPIHWDGVIGSTLLTQARFEEQLGWDMIVPAGGPLFGLEGSAGGDERPSRRTARRAEMSGEGLK
jgi:sialic acid synthase